MNIVETATSYLGKVKYRYGANNIDGGVGDCSAYTQTVFKKATGVDIGRSALAQSSAGSYVNKSELKTGDLIIFQNTYKNGASHTGIYIGDGKFINNGDSGVKIENLSSSYWSSHYMQGRRITDSGGNAITLTTKDTTTDNASDNSSEKTDEKTNIFGSAIVIICAVLLIALCVTFFTKSLGVTKSKFKGGK